MCVRFGGEANVKKNSIENLSEMAHFFVEKTQFLYCLFKSFEYSLMKIYFH